MMNMHPRIITPSEIVPGCRAVIKPGQYLILPPENRCSYELAFLRNVQVQVMTTRALGASFVQNELLFGPAGGTTRPLRMNLEHFFLMLEGALRLTVDGTAHELVRGGYAWVPPGSTIEFSEAEGNPCRAIWFRRRYARLEGCEIPAPLFGNEGNVPAVPEVDINPEQRLVPFQDPGYDMAFNLIVVPPGGYYGLAECHAWEHGMYMLEGEGQLWLNGNYHEVKEGDFIYIAPYCPEFFSAHGWNNKPVRFLLSWDANRDYANELEV